MADAGLPAPPASPIPPAPQTSAPQPPHVQPPVPPNQHIPTQPKQHMPQLNWSHFKPEFAAKPDGDAEAHLLRMNDWMDTHTHFKKVSKSNILPYINRGSKIMVWVVKTYKMYVWIGLQNQFKQQYSKIGNTREQLFHTWWSFHFDESADTLDSYVTCIRQVATLLDYGKPKV